MLKVLHIIGSLNIGGAENFLVNFYRNIDKNKFHFDFVVYDQPKGNNNYYNEILESGAKIYYVTTKERNIFKNVIEIKNIVKNNSYDIVWRHNSNCVGGIDLIAAKLGGAKYTIFHSHSSKCSKKEEGIHYLLRPIVNMFIDERYACSQVAGEWMFGKRKFQIIYNGIDVAKFKANQLVRDSLREKYDLKNDVVIGHVGRFHPVKNHKFVVDIVKNMSGSLPNIKLVFVGGGELEDEIKKYVKKCGIDKKVLFLGDRSDVHDIMQMFDVFVFPSLFEGFGIVLVEAQAAGIPCVASSNVPSETNITSHVYYESLDEPIDDWSSLLLKAANGGRYDESSRITESGFDMKTVTRKLEKRLCEIGGV